MTIPVPPGHQHTTNGWSRALTDLLTATIPAPLLNTGRTLARPGTHPFNVNPGFATTKFTETTRVLRPRIEHAQGFSTTVHSRRAAFVLKGRRL